EPAGSGGMVAQKPHPQPGPGDPAGRRQPGPRGAQPQAAGPGSLSAGPGAGHRGALSPIHRTLPGPPQTGTGGDKGPSAR
ncbi:hypothetical protein ABTB17_19105, partial [Acinetobacter baumannii]